MSLQWSDDLLTGHAHIDAQHRRIFAAFGEFLDACDHGRAPEEIAGLFAFLDDYTRQHFADEECLLAGTPQELAAHREEHARFLARLAELEAELANHGPTVGVIIHTSKALIYWLSEHIRSVDTRVVGQKS